MTAPHPSQPPPPRRGLSPTHWLLIFVAFVWSGMMCAGVCGGAFLVLGYRATAVSGRPRILTPPALPAPVFDGNDWMAQRERGQLYQTAIESVATDDALKERLGNDIEPSLEADDLFERKSGDLTTEEIEFGIVGTKGKAKVTVRAARNQRFKPTEITVTLEDGSTIEVAPLDRPLVPVR